MRLIFIFIFAALIQVSGAVKAQKVTLNEKNVTIAFALEQIRKQIGYDILYNEEWLDKSKRISVNLKNVSLSDALHQVLESQPLSFELDEHTIILSKVEPSFRDKVISFLAAIDVTGRVLDENNAPLVGAVVKVKGGTVSTATNSKGEFTLKNVDENAILTISFLGYETLEVKAAKNIASIKLTLSTDKLEEVEINAGYYTVTERERTGSISRITSKNIERQPINNILQAMQANIPGVQITQDSGVPGGGFTVQIRGQNSIAQGNDPFYIIDGVPFTATSLGGSRSELITRNASPLASINPADIESIEILKDADATAIYGSRGANGVILISTKKGKIGKAKSSFSFNQGFSRVGNKIDLMNTSEYLVMRREALANDKLSVGSVDYDINGIWDSNRNVDWQKELIGGTAEVTNIQASLSGGGENINYLIGGSHYREGTVFPGESSYGRGSGNFSLQYKSANKKLNLSFDANYSQVKSNLFTTDLTQFIVLAPNYPTLLDDNGALNWQDKTMYENPIANTRRPYNAKTNNLLGHTTVEYSIIPDLKIKGSIGYTIMDRKEVALFPLTTYSPAYNYGVEMRNSYFTNNSTNTWIAESQAIWSKNFGDSKLNLLFGTTFQQNLTDGQEIKGSGFTSDALMGNIAAASVLTIQNRSYLQYRYTAVFGRINYIFKDKYIINSTGRRDGSSRFGPDNRFANFGAIGTAWIISNEDFLKKNLSFVSFAKLRGSYGVTGNDAIPDYGYLSLWKTYTSTYQGVSTMYPTVIANANYAWEVNKKAEVAIDLGLLKDKINLTAGYYSNRSSSQLIFRSLTPSTGFGAIQDNLPATVGNTGWEFELTSKNIDNAKFKWTTSFNLTIPKNKLIDFPNLSKSTYASSYEIGYPLSISKLYNTSLDPQTGLYIREDHDGNGVIDVKDRYIVKFKGQKFYGGILNSFVYRDLKLDFQFQFVKQTGESDFSGFSSPGLATNSRKNNQLKLITKRWQNPENISIYQKYSTLITSNTSYNDAIVRGTYGLMDNSFIRLKNVSLSYSLPQNLRSKLKLNETRFFLQGQNLITITRYKGLDPETQSLSRLPILQTFIAGIQVTL